MDMPGATGAADVHGDNHDERSTQGTWLTVNAWTIEASEAG
jgi:hypothetical protein